MGSIHQRSKRVIIRGVKWRFSKCDTEVGARSWSRQSVDHFWGPLAQISLFRYFWVSWKTVTRFSGYLRPIPIWPPGAQKGQINMAVFRDIGQPGGVMWHLGKRAQISANFSGRKGRFWAPPKKRGQKRGLRSGVPAQSQMSLRNRKF